MKKYIAFSLFCVLLLPQSLVCQKTGGSVFSPVYGKLKVAGASEEFMNALQQESAIQFNDKFVKINVSGYLKSSKADYSHNFNTQSVNANAAFIKANDSLLSACATKYGVPKEVIASVIWVETKHGKILGKYNVASAFMSVALSDSPEYVEQNKEEMRRIITERHPKEPAQRKRIIDSLEKVIEARASKKAKWAVGELMAMQTMWQQSGKEVLRLEGSWAGAFGLSQFLPSSYVKLGADGDGDGKVDLFSLADAAHSVGNYLRHNGWGTNRKSQEKAVFSYNNSSAYVEAVLKLAELSAEKVK